MEDDRGDNEDEGLTYILQRCKEAKTAAEIKSGGPNLGLKFPEDNRCIARKI